MMKFEDLLLAPSLLRSIAAEGYATPTPIQAQAIPHILAGCDLLGCAQTGTGKTAAFALPILHRLSQANLPTHKHSRKTRVLVLSPTRELASQIGESFQTYGRHTGLRLTVIFGGVGQQPQVKALRAGVEIIVATPGRLLDLMNQGHVDLSAVDTFVLDEADRMLDMGFIHDIRQVVARLPRRRQTLFFSATMPPDIRQLADTILNDPVKVQVTAESSTVDSIAQSVYFVDQRHKPALLQHLLRSDGMGRALVFTRTKHGADKVARHLEKAGIRAEAIHGNKSQAARQRSLEKFRSSSPPVLVATDVAARGLDIDRVSHVINFDLPNVPETYVHRIGRTGRAGATGVAISFCGGPERADLKMVERLIRMSIPVRTDHPQYAATSPPASAPAGQRHPRPNNTPQGAGGANNRKKQRWNRKARSFGRSPR
ncbi:MAG TPA: DEAD/DEAH box helicase [Pirellulales bacterium]|jgi:ATP-dependent RNA helicase RhlE|nr:DEAD/DEAH box helicase [Pirellulales bacterium]